MTFSAPFGQKTSGVFKRIILIEDKHILRYKGGKTTKSLYVASAQVIEDKSKVKAHEEAGIDSSFKNTRYVMMKNSSAMN